MIKLLKRFLFSNESTGQTLLKNTTWLFIGEIVGRLIRFWIVIYAARVLGAAEYGIFSYILTLAAFATILADIGISPLLTRETSKAPELRQRLFGALLIAKLGLLIVVGLAIYFITPLITNLSAAIFLLPLAIGMFAFDSLREFGFGMYRGLEKMELEAITKIIMNALITALGFAALWYQASARSITMGYVIGAGIGCFLTALLLRKYWTHAFKELDLKLIWPLIRLAWPLGLLQLLGAIMINTDMVMLGWLRTPTELGYYGAVQKIILLLYVAPTLIASAVFPLFSRLAGSANERFRVFFEKSVAASELLAMPLVAGGIALAPAIIKLLFGAQYLPGTTTFVILLSTLLIVFPSTIFSNALFAFNKQRTFMLFVGIGAISNILLDALLIPRYGIEGSAVATLISQILTNVFVWRAMRQTLSFSVRQHLLRIFFSSALIGILAYLLSLAGLPVLLTIGTCIAAYIALLLLFREPLLVQIKSQLKVRQSA
jgi:O-antigen/teichoic acid export membrane protein